MSEKEQEKQIVPEHDEVIHITFVEHYEAHDKREESKQFRATKKAMHKEGLGCYIGNGRCKGNIEIHHNIIEWSASTEIDMAKVLAAHPNFDGVDGRYQMLPLCAKHHRGAGGYGIHGTPYPIWILQKYMTEEALDDFERAVEAELAKKKGVVSHPKKEQFVDGDVIERGTHGNKTPQ
jgi:hypothetical protein